VADCAQRAIDAVWITFAGATLSRLGEDNLVQTRVDLLSHFAKLRPLLAKLRRLVRRLELFRARPLNVIYQMAAVLAAVQAE
jgi:hypothetical protein